MDIESGVIGAIARELNLKPEDVTIDSTFEGLNIDELDHITIIMALEEAFDIALNDELIDTITCVKALVNAVREAVDRSY